MGTSSNSPGGKGSSPPVPPWAEDDYVPTTNGLGDEKNQDQPPESTSAKTEDGAPGQSNSTEDNNLPLRAEDASASENNGSMLDRTRSFRHQIRKFASSNNRTSTNDNLRSALREFSKVTSGGRSAFKTRMGSTVRTGSYLISLLSSGSSTNLNIPGSLNLQSLTGLSIDEAVNAIATAITPFNGDGDRIRSAIVLALSEALEGQSTFDGNSITDMQIINTMCNYLAHSVFIQIIENAGNGWNAAPTPRAEIESQDALYEVIKVVVNTHIERRQMNNIKTMSALELIKEQNSIINDVLSEWEKYK